MARTFKLPDLGEGVHEGEVLAVFVSAGQMVSEGDIIFEVETDKAAVEIPSPYGGIVAEVMVRPGDTVKVGEVMLRFENGDSRVEKTAPAEGAGRIKPRGQEEEPQKTPPGGHGTPVPASPATRRLARELGVDLHQVQPADAGGVVTADDVRSFGKRDNTPVKIAAEPEKPITPAADRSRPNIELPDFSQWGPVERIPFRSIRRATAAHMVKAWSHIPHVSSQESIDVTRLEAFRQKHKSDIQAAGGRLTLTVFALKAVATALKTYPQFNASLDVDNQEIIQKQYYHIGVAVNTDSGLIVPVIRDVDRKSIKELSIELQQLVQTTREHRIARESLQGGTFTITNAGAMGGGFFTPIVNFPEVAILGMGKARMQPVVDADDGDRIVPRLLMPVVLCFDHRVADGAGAISFLRVVMDALEDPDELLMTMI
ncbi:dihydrolipoamide acetyltransferase family protein [Desulfosarcina sp.]|uniref:dihydrolipoamide acetyltransferase family protein n=1 Tax=Desulfosarcina sp. TaxID=2027861 RepID=UPI003970ECF5